MRLIDADALQREYAKYHDGKRIVIVDLAPTIEERKTGKWVFKHNSSDIWCSECDENYEKCPGEFNYCPNCGADMRGEQP